MRLKRYNFTNFPMGLECSHHRGALRLPHALKNHYKYLYALSCKFEGKMYALLLLPLHLLDKLCRSQKEMGVGFGMET